MVYAGGLKVKKKRPAIIFIWPSNYLCESRVERSFACFAQTFACFALRKTFDRKERKEEDANKR
jgi:hypothetical protein